MPSDDEAPLSDAEWARAQDFPRFWRVWSEDRYSGADPAWVYDACLSEAEARAVAAASLAKLAPGSFERFDVTGPHALIEERRDCPSDFRRLLALLDGKRGR